LRDLLTSMVLVSAQSTLESFSRMARDLSVRGVFIKESEATARGLLWRRPAPLLADIERCTIAKSW
jgi:hypothetical protein